MEVSALCLNNLKTVFIWFRLRHSGDPRLSRVQLLPLVYKRYSITRLYFVEKSPPDGWRGIDQFSPG